MRCEQHSPALLQAEKNHLKKVEDQCLQHEIKQEQEQIRMKKERTIHSIRAEMQIMERMT